MGRRDATPVFILGAARSATTTVAQLVGRCAKVKGYGEGHTFALMQQILGMVDRYFDGHGIAQTRAKQVDPTVYPIWSTALAEIGRDKVIEGVRALFAGLSDTLYGTRLWFDKTPDEHMILAIGHLLAIYPRAKFIFVKRNGIDNVQSRRAKFPKQSFEEHCRRWTAVMTHWADARRQLSFPALEIEQSDLSRDLTGEARRIVDFIYGDAPDRPQVESDVDYHAESSAIMVFLDENLDLRSYGWTEAEIAQFRKICGPAMHRFGYWPDPAGPSDSARMPRRFHLTVPYVKQNLTFERLTTSPDRLGAFGAGTIHLAPAPPGAPPPVVRFAPVYFADHTAFDATVSVRDARAHPVVFRMTVRRATEETPLIDQRITVAPGQDVQWHVDTGRLSGHLVVGFSTAMAEGAPSNQHAAAVVARPTFS